MIDTTGQHRDIQEVISPITDDVSLFDLESDPQETANVARKFPKIVTKMTTQLRQWQASVEQSLTGAAYTPELVSARFGQILARSSSKRTTYDQTE